MINGASSGRSRRGGPERRRSPRLPTRGRLVGCLLESDLPVKIREIGVGGFAAETLEPLPLNELHVVRLLARDDTSAVVEARSIHSWPSCTDDGVPCFVTGFAFRHDDSPGTERLVRALIEKITSPGLYHDERH